METSISLLNVDPTVCPRTVFAIALHPLSCLLVIGVAVLTLRLVLVTRETGVPWYLVREAHLEVAGIANDMWVRIFVLFVDLSVLTAGS